MATTSIGQRIAALRQRRGWSQAELAEGLPLSHSYVSLIESGRRQPRQRVLELLAAKLECSVEYLVTGRGDNRSRSLELDLRFAELALRSGDAAAARERFAEILEQARLMGPAYATEAYEAQWGLSRADETVGNLEAAIAGLEELSAAPDLPPTVSRTGVAMALCRAYWQCGDLTRAVEVGEAALRALDAADDRLASDEATELGSTLVVCYYERGDLTRAHLLARTLIAEAERDGSTRARGAAYWNAALVAEARGELDSAKVFAERALALYSEIDNTRAIALLRLTNAWVLLQHPKPRHTEALELLHRAYADFLEVGNPVDLASTETELARCELLAGDPDAAAAMASNAIGRLADAPRVESARARAVLADAQLAMGDIDGAVESYTKAATELGSIGATRQAATVWRELADAMASAGRQTEAIAAYRRATDAVGVHGRRGMAVGTVSAAGVVARRR